MQILLFLGPQGFQQLAGLGRAQVHGLQPLALGLQLQIGGSGSRSRSAVAAAHAWRRGRIAVQPPLAAGSVAAGQWCLRALAGCSATGLPIAGCGAPLLLVGLASWVGLALLGGRRGGARF